MHMDNLNSLLIVHEPSAMLKYLMQTRKLDVELEALIGVPQDRDHHPEGDAFKHTMMVMDEAAEISERYRLNERDNAILRLAALTHDMGKATHTQIQDSGKITSYGHPEAGILPATTFMQRSHVNPLIMQEVIPLVNLHMAWVGFAMPDITSKQVRKLIRRLQPSNLQMLTYVVEADMSGRGGKYFKQGVPQRMYDIVAVANSLNDPIDAFPDHLVSGQDIMEATGIEPSPLLGKIKAALYKAQLEGRFSTRADGIFFLLHHVVIAENA